MKRASGTGGIRKLSGKRRKPYQAVVTAGKEWKNGRIVQKQRSIGVYATRREAQAALEEYNRTHFNLDMRSITFAEAFDILKQDYTTDMLRVRTVSYNSCVSLHNMRLIDIRMYDLEAVAKSVEHLSKRTQAAIRSLIHDVFQWGIANDVIVRDYSENMKFRRYKETKKKSSYTKQEVQKVLKDGDCVQKILLYSGMRIKELLDMPLSEVYEEDGILCFHVITAKTKAGIRVIPVHSEIISLIPTDGDYVIQPHISYVARRKQFVEWNESHGIEHTFHELRHTFATYGKACGMDDFYRKALMGHAQSNVTDAVYTDAMIKDLHNQIELLDYSKV